MCGIIAIVRRPSDRPAPDVKVVRDGIAEASRMMADRVSSGALIETANAAADALFRVDDLLKGVPGVETMLSSDFSATAVQAELDEIWRTVEGLDAGIDKGDIALAGPTLESANLALGRVRDAVWAIRNDRLRTARAVADLAGPSAGRPALEAMVSVQSALSAIDRLEVRGRDSAGLHLLVRNHALDPQSSDLQALIAGRTDDPAFTNQSVRLLDGQLSFVYKAAAEIGELGDNTAEIRAAITADRLLARALESPDARTTVVGHTRWASVGIISEANAHPLNSEEVDGSKRPYVIGVLNGDVDNHADLKVSHDLKIRSDITTDAKVIPTLVARRLAAGDEPIEAFRSTVCNLEGSVAIAAHSAAAPDSLLLALRGSGQALYVGLAEDSYIVASEPYGVIEETSRYVRLDGETPSDPANPTASRGQVFRLDENQAGTLDGLLRRSYDGTDLPLAADDVVVAEITTRDIDRGDAPHYLLKELKESPQSFHKTLRGKIAETEDGLRVRLGDDVIPEPVRQRIADGSITRIRVIGQGTAAVAGKAVATAIQNAVGDRFAVDALPATELSGFQLTGDMSDQLIVAISQSGTTTDTNRTVDLVRGRGAAVLAIVNRRGSDLTDKADGVLYTSDGRDVEMSVASTKAFYAQIAAGFLLAAGIAQVAGISEADSSELLEALRAMPDAMISVLGQQATIARIAAAHAPSRRYWAIVGNGPNFVSAHELRIKLSELCYKSIACDVTEDKKHIDLSSEPLILVCAAGLSGSTGDDVSKEVAIYRAHKAAPIVIAGEGEAKFEAALDVIRVPSVHPQLAFILSAMAGHIFGYEAARAIDASAIPLRKSRASIEAALADADGELDLEALALEQAEPAAEFLDGIRARKYDGHLEAATAVRLSSLFRYATGISPLDMYAIEHGKVGTPSAVIEDLMSALNQGIDELTRPIDAIKHQAKTVTVGISRSDEGLVQVPLVKAVLDAGASRDRLSYRVMRALAALDPAVDKITGFTRYRVEGRVEGDDATAQVVDKGGIARELSSRVEREPKLRGTKHRAAYEREVTVARGRSDGRTVVIVPEVRGNQTVGLTLLHCQFKARLAPATFRSVLEGYRGRYDALRDAVTETEPAMRDDILGELDVVDVLVVPVHVLAEHWQSS